MKFVFINLLFLCFFSSCVKQQNWNQYLGPNRNASESGTKILRSWGENGPTKLWSFPLGTGYGGASIFDNEVFVLDRKAGDADILRCIDLLSGDENWNYQYVAKGELPYPGSRAVPTVDKNYIWSVGPHGHFYCIDRQTHQPVWFHNILEKFDGVLPLWGVSQSPLVYNNLVIVAPQGKKAGVVAFNKKTGERVWESRPLTGHNFHVSQVLANFGSTDQVIMISPYDRRDSTKTHEVVAFDANTGKELWTYKGLKSFGTITPATVIDDKRFFITDCSYNNKYNPVPILLEIVKKDGVFETRELFFTEEAGSKMHPAVLFENHLYFNHTTNPNQLICMTLDGEVVWEKDSTPNFDLGSLILIDGLIITQNGKNGDIHLVDPSPEGYRELGKASFFDSKKSQAWAPLAFSDGKLIVRDLEKMVCIDLQN